MDGVANLCLNRSWSFLLKDAPVRILVNMPRNITDSETKQPWNYAIMKHTWILLPV